MEDASGKMPGDSMQHLHRSFTATEPLISTPSSEQQESMFNKTQRQLRATNHIWPLERNKKGTVVTTCITKNTLHRYFLKVSYKKASSFLGNNHNQ